MKATETITTPGDYRLRVRNPAEDKGGSPFTMQLYRNRTRLALTQSLHEVVWRGSLATGDLVEADGEQDITLSVELITDHAYQPDPRNEPAVAAQRADDTVTVTDITDAEPVTEPVAPTIAEPAADTAGTEGAEGNRPA